MSDEAIAEKEILVKELTLGNAERQIREYFVLDAICKKEGLEVGEEEVDEEVVRHARAHGLRAADVFSKLESEGRLDELKVELQARKAAEYLVEQAEIKVVPRKLPPQEEEKPDCGHEHHDEVAGSK